MKTFVIPAYPNAALNIPWPGIKFIPILSADYSTGKLIIIEYKVKAGAVSAVQMCSWQNKVIYAAEGKFYLKQPA